MLSILTTTAKGIANTHGEIVIENTTINAHAIPTYNRYIINNAITVPMRAPATCAILTSF